MSSFNITSTIKQYPQKYPYPKIKEAVLGKRYELSLVFVGAKRAATLNLQNRGKDYVPNVLSFPLTEQAGEIFICPSVAEKEAPKFGLSYEGYIAYLFIHGLLHLKGYDHSDTMERLERKFCKAFSVS
jgi:probable rRNA maturation factor